MSTIHRYSESPPNLKARILNEDDSSFYREVAQKAKKDFKHCYHTIMHNINIDGGVGTNFYFNVLGDKILGESERIATFQDWGYMLNGGDFTEGKYYFVAPQLVWNPMGSQEKFPSRIHKNIANELERRVGQEYLEQEDIVKTLLISKIKLLYDPNEVSILSQIEVGLQNATINIDERFSQTNGKIAVGTFEKVLTNASNSTVKAFVLTPSGIHAGGEYTPSELGRIAIVKNN